MTFRHREIAGARNVVFYRTGKVSEAAGAR